MGSEGVDPTTVISSGMDRVFWESVMLWMDRLLQ